MARMTEKDARTYIKASKEIWKMPLEWVEMQSGENHYQLTEEVALDIQARLVEDSGSTVILGSWIKFTDLYGTVTQLRADSIQGFRRITRLSFAKWVAGLDVRNFQADS